jgi:hypothetical protein
VARTIKVPDWLGERDLRSPPKERRYPAEAPDEDREIWATPKAAGIRVGSTSFAWTREGLSRVLVYVTAPMKGSGGLDLILMWGDRPASILSVEPFDEESEARFLELGPAVAELLDVPFYVNGGADA